MPVAVDPTPAMAASKAKDGPMLGVQEASPNESPKKLTKKQRKHAARLEKAEERPVAGSSKSTEDLTTWAWRSLTESSASKVPILFTRDGSYFFSASGASVKIYSVSTGDVVSTLSPSEASRPADSALRTGDAVTCMALSPNNPFQLITGSMDGLIRIWDFLDAVLLRAFDISLPIFHLAVHEKHKDQVFVAVSRLTQKVNTSGNIQPGEDNCSVLRVALNPTKATAQSLIQKPSETAHVGKTRKTAGLTISPNGSWLVAIAGHKSYVAQTDNLRAGFTKFVSPERLTCLAFHPSEDYFATGDDKGVIRLWYCLDEGIGNHAPGVEKKAPTTTMHWHAHAVSSIAFTANGAYLLSGGEESVLVIWQLHTGKKEFVPRVGAPIVNVAVCRAKERDEEYLLGLTDASFVFVRSGTLRISRTVARIKLDPAVSHTRPSSSSAVPLAIHPQTSTLVLPSSHPSSLQLYAPSSYKLLHELEVCPSNRISRRDEKPLEPSRVERVVVSDTGAWMATVDSREGDDTVRGEVYLKIWFWTGRFWVLNTRIDRPHGLKKVTSVVFRPRAQDGAAMQLVTTGDDGNIKLWRLRSSKTKMGKTEEFWVARSTFRFRDETPSHAEYSFDGSLLAVSLGCYVAVYDPETTILVQTFTSPDCSRVLSAHFIGRSSRFLATVGVRDVVLWDIISQTVRWHYRSALTITGLALQPEDTFVILERSLNTTATRAHIFSPASPLPSQSRSLPFYLRSIIPCPPSWTSSNSAAKSSLAFIAITESWSVVLLGDHVELPQDEGSEAKGLKGSSPAPRRTLFQDIFGASALNDLSRQPSAPSVPSQATWKGKEVEKVFDAPAYLMPPLDTLFEPLMSDFLTTRSHGKSAADADEQEPGQEDVEMDVEGDEAPVLVGNRLERVVNSDEMNAMIDLFVHHGVQCELLNLIVAVETNADSTCSTMSQQNPLQCLMVLHCSRTAPTKRHIMSMETRP
ncbi:WD40 repeat-like protein [Panus rudis PR-1116 ss-1]|nr:WD40 repeat-like protein [Panus rudis PR-1116 ss-1]